MKSLKIAILAFILIGLFTFGLRPIPQPSLPLAVVDGGTGSGLKLGDVVTTAPVTGGVNDIFPGADADTLTLGITMLGDLAVTAPVTGAASDVFPGANGAKATIGVATALTTASGVSELATNEETVTGTAADRVTTPASITAKMAAPGAIGGTTPASIAGTTGTFSGNITAANLAGILAYGVEWDEDNSSPTLTRTGALASFAAAASPGNAALSIQAAMRRCILTDAGAVAYYLGATDSTKKEDGTTASVLDGTDGQVMVEIPKFAYKYSYVAATNVHSWSVSSVLLPGYEWHPAFYKDGAWVDHRYIGAYEAVGYDNGTSAYIDCGTGNADNWAAGAVDIANDSVGSVSGYAPMMDETRDEFRTLALKRGAGWRQQDFYLTSAVQLLYLTEYASFYSQSMIGAGRTELTGGTWVKDSYIGVTGKSNAAGNATANTGGDTNDAYMSYRGIENFYGNLWQWIDGINVGLAATHDGADNQATVFTDSGETWPTNAFVGMTLVNTSDGDSTGTVTANDGTTITVGAGLTGGTDQDFDIGDVINISNIPWVSNTETDFADDTYTNYTLLKDTSGDEIILSNTDGYQTTLEQTKGGFLPSAVGGDSNTYITDYYYQAAGWRVVAFGGYAIDGANAGVVYWHSNHVFATDGLYIGGRVSF